MSQRTQEQGDFEFHPELRGYVGALVVILVIGLSAVGYGLYSGSFSIIALASIATAGVLYGQKLYLERTTYTLTDNKLVYDREIFGTQHQELSYDKIQTTDVRQSFLNKIMGEYGTIQVSTAGSGGTDLRMWGIKNAVEVHSELVRRRNSQMESNYATDSEVVEGELSALEEAQKLRGSSSDLYDVISAAANSGGDN
jgi:uncharacterized membrane protein YdbT with pleckstrin-like domain